MMLLAGDLEGVRFLSVSSVDFVRNLVPSFLGDRLLPLFSSPLDFWCFVSRSPFGDLDIFRLGLWSCLDFSLVFDLSR